jgi:hypothetical protein
MRIFWILFFMVVAPFCHAQETEKRHVEYDSKPLNQVLTDIELKFDVKYSYADTIAAGKRITVAAGRYSLENLNKEIEHQAALTIVPIDSRYYSIYKAEEKAVATALQEIIISGFLSKGITKTSREIVISPQKVEELPGVTDADILLSLQQLPGVKSPNETATGLHIRGGTPDQNLILWDGIRMYHPGHLFGMISGFNPNVRQTVHFFTKATDPRFGERISSVIDIRTTDKIADSLSVDAGINGLAADAYIIAPIVKKKLGIQVSGRKSYTELWQTPTFDALAKKVFQNTNFTDFDDGNRFGFQDFSAKVNFEPNERNNISATGIVIDNHLDFRSAETGEVTNQIMDILNYGSSVNWKHEYSSRLDQELRLHFSTYTFDYLEDRKFATGDFEDFIKMNRIVDSGIELNFGYAATDALTFGYGYQLSGNDVSHSFTSKNPNLEIELDQKHRFNIAHSGYFNAGYVLDTWDFQAGARYSYFGKLGESSFEPRVLLQKKLNKSFAGQISYERKSQILSQVRESVANDLSLENYVWILSDGGDYPIQNANQYTAGITYKSSSVLIDLDAYYKTIDGITSLSFGFLHEYDSSIHKGNGYTKGIDVLVQKTAPTWRTWATYTFQDSKNRYNGLNGNNYFPISSDITHAVTISAHKDWGKFSASAGWFWHTGKPYSEIGDDNQIESFNSNRLPAYHRLDVSAAYAFSGATWKGKAGFSIGNVYGNHTVISREYQRTYGNTNDVITSEYTSRDYYSLGLLPNVFIRISF